MQLHYLSISNPPLVWSQLWLFCRNTGCVNRETLKTSSSLKHLSPRILLIHYDFWYTMTKTVCASLGWDFSKILKEFGHTIIVNGERASKQRECGTAYQISALLLLHCQTEMPQSVKWSCTFRGIFMTIKTNLNMHRMLLQKNPYSWLFWPSATLCPSYSLASGERTHRIR